MTSVLLWTHSCNRVLIRLRKRCSRHLSHCSSDLRAQHVQYDFIFAVLRQVAIASESGNGGSGLKLGRLQVLYPLSTTLIFDSELSGRDHMTCQTSMISPRQASFLLRRARQEILNVTTCQANTFGLWRIGRGKGQSIKFVLSKNCQVLPFRSP